MVLEAEGHLLQKGTIELQKLPDYSTSWRKYKTLKNIYVGLFVGWFPTAIAAALIGSMPGRVLSAIVVVWFVLLAVFFFALVSWRCPRCAKRFASGASGLFAGSCANCGLPRYANSDA